MQVFVEPPNRYAALLLLLYATNGQLFDVPVEADFSNITPSNVDIALGNRTIAQLQVHMTKLRLPEMPVWTMPDERTYPSAETVNARIFSQLESMSHRRQAAEDQEEACA